MFRIDAHTHTLMGQDRIDSLNRSRRIEAKPVDEAESLVGRRRGGVTPASPLSLPEALCTTAAHLRSSRA